MSESRTLYPVARVIDVEDADFGDVSLKVAKPLNGQLLKAGMELYFSPAVTTRAGRRKPAKTMKRVFNYDPSVPRCATCQQYRPPNTRIKDGKPRTHVAFCKLLSVIVTPVGQCDMWKGQDGSTLST